MRKLLVILLVVVGGWISFADLAKAVDVAAFEQPAHGVPVRTAIYTRGESSAQSSASEEYKGGDEPSSAIKLVGWRGYYRPFGWYGVYGPRYYAGPRYYVGYRPRYYGYYAPYASYLGGYYGGIPYAAYGAMPYTTFYAPPAYYYGGYGGLRGYSGCWYW